MLDGETIWYYAAGYTDSGKKIPMNKDSGEMFSGCTGLTSLNVGSWNTALVTDMNSVFKDCSSLTSLDLSSWDTARVTDISWMFEFCENLRTIFASNRFVTTGVGLYSDYDVFYGCVSLVGGAGTAYRDRITDKSRARIDGGTSNPGYFTAKP